MLSHLKRDENSIVIECPYSELWASSILILPYKETRHGLEIGLFKLLPHPRLVAETKTSAQRCKCPRVRGLNYCPGFRFNFEQKVEHFTGLAVSDVIVLFHCDWLWVIWENTATNIAESPQQGRIGGRRMEWLLGVTPCLSLWSHGETAAPGSGGEAGPGGGQHRQQDDAAGGQLQHWHGDYQWFCQSTVNHFLAWINIHYYIRPAWQKRSITILF